MSFFKGESSQITLLYDEQVAVEEIDPPMNRIDSGLYLRYTLLLAVLAACVAAAFAQNNWTHTNYWDQNSQTQVVQVTSMVTHKLTCTVTWRGTYIGPQVPGAPTGSTGGTFTMVLPAYPGSGAAIVGRQGAKYITAFSYQIVCS